MADIEIIKKVGKMPGRLAMEKIDPSEDIAPFEPDQVYYLATPYESYGVAEILLEELNQL